MTAELNFNTQPVTSHYFNRGDKLPPEHLLALGQCGICGVVQLDPPFPFQSVIPPHAWIAYREPEDHLDHMVSMLAEKFEHPQQAQVLGLSYKDETTLQRLPAYGFKNLQSLNLQKDLGSTSPYANIESVPGLLTSETSKKIVDKIGRFDIIIARHVLEHAENPIIFMKALEILLAPNGLIVFEVPDCEANMERCDVAMIWEEHTCYFTPNSFQHVFKYFGYKVSFYRSYPLSFENSLVVFVHQDQITRFAQKKAISRNEEVLFKNFCSTVKQNAICIQLHLKQAIRNGDRFAVYGAGHLACAFINLLGLQKYITCIVDDTPEKQGLKLPGSGLEIEAPSALQQKEITICLLALSVEIEDKVIAKNAEFVTQGGEFYSIFNSSSRSYLSLL